MRRKTQIGGIPTTELLKIGMRYWEDYSTQMYIEWVVRRRGRVYFAVGLLTGTVLELFVLCLIAILTQQQ